MPLREKAQVRYAGRKEPLNCIMQKHELAKPKSDADGLGAERDNMVADASGIKTEGGESL